MTAPRDAQASLPRRVVLEVRGGPPGAQRTVLSPGQRLRVGRTSFADLEIPGDERMSREHWEITWDGSVCEVRDLGGAGGILVGGEPKERAAVRSGAWIRAGRTDFSVYFEDAAPAPVPASRAAQVEYALSVLAPIAAGGGLFAVLDAARSDRLLRLLRTSIDPFMSLYEGLRSEIEEDVAPYLVRFERASRLLPRVLAEGWGRSWGIHLESDAPLGEVRAHRRRLLVATRESDRRPMYFRFYDPRVLRAFLPIATARQRGGLFGPVQRYLAEGPDGEGMWEQAAPEGR
jgi:hypothetical protein